MHNFVEFALLGLGAGAVYALMAQGLVLIYRASGIVNFSQAAMAMVGAYIYAELRLINWPFAPALICAALGCAILGGLIYHQIMRRLRDAAPINRVIATLGVLIILQSAATLHYAANEIQVASSLPQGPVTIFGIQVPQDRLWLLLIAAVLTALLWAASRFTSFGRGTTAVAENQVAAAALGWSPDRVAIVNWALGSALAAVAGVLIVPLTGLSVTTLILLIVPVLAAALVGGFSSYPLILLGGVLIGILQSEVGWYVKLTGWPEAAPFIVILVILVVRGKSLPLRGHLIERLPQLGSGIVRSRIVIPLVVITGVLIYWVIPTSWVLYTSTSLVTAIMLLSVVVITGYAGQLSLAQFTLGGLGALFAALLVRDGWPFAAAMVIGLVGAIVCGLILALPALRTRGVNLAVVTLGVGSAVAAVVFSNGQYVGVDGGTRVGSTNFIGINIDYITAPKNYALFALACLVVASLLVSNLRRSRAGRRLIAVRTNERAAASLGVSVLGSKMYAFGVSAGIAGLAGILYGFQGDTVTYANFEPTHSITAVTLAVVGGVAYVSGASLGATLIAGGIGTIITNAIWGQNGADWLALIGGVFLILLILQDPDGMAHANAKLIRSVIGRFSRGAKKVAVSDPEVHSVVASTRVVSLPLTVDGISVRFGGVKALDNVSLTVNPGEIVGLIGPNGAGKTTFIDAVSGFVDITSGHVSLGERPIESWATHRRVRAGITRSFQSLELFDDITVRDNLRAASDSRDFFGYLSDLVWPLKTPLPSAAVGAMQEFRLEHELDRYPGDLPYGRRRLVAVARAIATQPSVLLLDEPTAGLSETESAEFAELIRRLATAWGIGILLIEHDMSVIMTCCDRVAVFEFGKKIADGSPEEIRGNPAVIAAYLGEPEDTPSAASAGANDLTHATATASIEDYGAN